MIYIDKLGLLNGIKDTMVQVLEKASKDYMDLLKTRWGGGPPGRSAWQEDLKRDLRIIHKSTEFGTMQYDIGFDYSQDNFAADSWKKMRAMVINYGSGSRGLTGIPIWTRPGEMVWNNDLSGMKTSTAKAYYALPDGFNQAGLMAFEETLDEFEPEFFRRVEQAWVTFDWAPYVKTTYRK